MTNYTPDSVRGVSSSDKPVTSNDSQKPLRRWSVSRKETPLTYTEQNEQDACQKVSELLKAARSGKAPKLIEQYCPLSRELDAGKCIVGF